MEITAMAKKKRKRKKQLEKERKKNLPAVRWQWQMFWPPICYSWQCNAWGSLPARIIQTCFVLFLFFIFLPLSRGSIRAASQTARYRWATADLFSSRLLLLEDLTGAQISRIDFARVSAKKKEKNRKRWLWLERASVELQKFFTVLWQHKTIQTLGAEQWTAAETALLPASYLVPSCILS